MQRRDAIALLLGGLGTAAWARASQPLPRRLNPAGFREIERTVAGRLGVAVLQPASGRRLAYRADERFPLCSTFKWLLAAQILSRVAAGREQPARMVPYTDRDLLDYAPVTRAQAARGGMTISALCAAAIEYSDNTAANLLLKTVGGPPALTAYVRTIGDPTTRLDRLEPDLNSATPGDERDTTTPGAMVRNLNVLLLGAGLPAEAQAQLIAWLKGCTTGAAKLRAGFPEAWAMGDKTGMGGHGSTNDVAIVWPVGRPPLLVAAYLTQCDASEADRNHALAQVGRLISTWAAS